MRVKSSTTTAKRRRKLKRGTKGMIKSRRASVRRAKEAILKAEKNVYRHRRERKRTFRALWIVRLNAAVRAEGMTYSRFIKGLKDKKIDLDRKTLADLAVHEPEKLRTLVEQIRK